MLLDELIRAVYWIGPRAAWESIRFAWLRDREQAKLPDFSSKRPLLPGEPLQASSQPWGAEIKFERARLRVEFLSRWALRIEWEPGAAPAPYSLAERAPDAPAPEFERTGDGWRLHASKLDLSVSRRGGVVLRNEFGDALVEHAPPTRRGERWRLEGALADEEHLYGLGQRAAPLNLRPGSYRLWNTDAGGSYEAGEDPLYMNVPILLGRKHAGGYLIYFENSHDGQVDLDEQLSAELSGGRMRYVLIAGSPAQALQHLTELLGRPCMPPRWALGYHQSRWSYQNEAEVRRVIEGFEKHRLPLAALHLDIDYMDGYRVFTVDERRFPDLSELADECRRRVGARLVAIVDPGVKVDPGYGLYREGLARGAFCALPDGSPLRGSVWPGAVHYPDFSDPDVRSWWGNQYRTLLDQGVAGIWHDMNEPTSFTAWGDMTLPLTTQHSLDGQGGDHRQAHNLYGHLMNRAGFEALRQQQPERRPFILSRSGWAGSARYAWNWTGDTASTWGALRQTVPTVLGLGLSGVPFTGPDIGGFSGAPGAELYLRWFQLAALLPFFRTHCSKSSPLREPWQFDAEVLEGTRQMLQLRQALLPYLYTLAAQAHANGWPLVRPLFWNRPQDQRLWAVDDAFLLGNRLLVAPVLEQGARARQVTLPAGRWYDFWREQSYLGPGKVSLSAPLDRLPLLVRAGSVLPQSGAEGIELHLYPPQEPAEDQPLYSDAGDGFGPSRWDYFSLQPRQNGYRLVWRSEGSFAWPHSTLQLVYHGPPPAELQLDGLRVPLDGRRVEVPRFQQADLTLSPDS